MKRILGLFLLIVGVAGVTHAQTETPLVTECGHKCSGSFTIQSNVLVPMAVTVEPYNFSLDKTGKHLHPLDSTTHVTLSETSARLFPKEIHEFNFKIRCDLMPCAVSFLSGMIVGHTADGLAIRLILDHAAYVCPKAKGCRASFLAQSDYRGPLSPVTPASK